MKSDDAGDRNRIDLLISKSKPVNDLIISIRFRSKLFDSKKKERKKDLRINYEVKWMNQEKLS